MPSSDGLRAPIQYVSTGQLPAADTVQALVDEAYELFRHDSSGASSTVYPALAKMPRDLYGVCVVGVNGAVHAAGDADVEFTIMSVAKPFVFALVCQELGVDEVRERLGVNATGLAFNSLSAIERGSDGRTNPLVNPGAIATTSLVPGSTLETKWEFIVEGLSRFAGRDLAIDDEVFASASHTNHRNQSMARLLKSYDRIFFDPGETVDLYTRQSSLSVSACDLAVMGATLADGGMNPRTGIRVVETEACRSALAVMATAGLYETTGDWLYTIGLPGKSGIGGGIVTAAPGKGGLGTFAPPLDAAGNSVKGQLAARHLSETLGLNLFVSQAHAADADS